MKRLELENRTDLKSEIPLETPYSVFIDPASACNYKCTFCMNQFIKNPHVMSMPLFKKIIDDLQAFPNPVKTLKLYGFGEPLLNKHFCEMVRYAKASNKVLKVNTTTNASLLTPELNQQLVDSGIDRLNISIYATDTPSYQKFTRNPKASWEHLIENLTDLYNRKNKDMIIFVKTTGDYLTEEQKAAFNRTFEAISDGHDIEHTMNCWTGLESISKEDQKVGIYGQPLKEVQVCPYVFYSFLIQANGYVSSCFLDWNSKMIIGDVNNESVYDLWNGDMMNYVRRQMLQGRRKEHPVCGKCNQVIAGMPVELDEHVQQISQRMSTAILLSGDK